MGYKDMRAAIEEIIGEKKTQETDVEILQAYHECKLTGIFILNIKTCEAMAMNVSVQRKVDETSDMKIGVIIVGHD